MRGLKSVFRLVPILGIATIMAPTASDRALAQCDAKGTPAGVRSGDSAATLDVQPADGQTDLTSQIKLFKGGEVLVLAVPCSREDMPIAARIDSVKGNRGGPTNLIPSRSPGAGTKPGNGPTNLIPIRSPATGAVLENGPARLVPPESPVVGATLRDGAAGGGVQVLAVEHGSPAWRGGLRQSDVIESVDRTPVGDMAALGRELDAAGMTAVLQVRRGGKETVIVLHR